MLTEQTTSNCTWGLVTRMLPYGKADSIFSRSAPVYVFANSRLPLVPPLAPLASSFCNLLPPSSYFSPSHPHSTLSSRPHHSSIPPSSTPPPPSTWPHMPVLLSTSVKECAQHNHRQGRDRPIQPRVSVSAELRFTLSLSLLLSLFYTRIGCRKTVIS